MRQRIMLNKHAVYNLISEPDDTSQYMYIVLGHKHKHTRIPKSVSHAAARNDCVRCAHMSGVCVCACVFLNIMLNWS